VYTAISKNGQQCIQQYLKRAAVYTAISKKREAVYTAISKNGQ
jgi:hypothetical protein